MTQARSTPYVNFNLETRDEDVIAPRAPAFPSGSLLLSW
jgi:hypothetical protein